MRRIICSIILVSFFIPAGYPQTYGLHFSSHEVVQEKRTSLNLFATESLCFKNDLTISFDLSLTPNMEVYFGYIFRLITADNQNIDLIYNQRLKTFNFIIGEKVSCQFAIDSLKLYNEWNRIAIHFNGSNKEVSLHVNERNAGKITTNFPDPLCFQLSFGARSFGEFQTADIPPMNIKDIRISESEKTRYYWPLSEIAGPDCADSVQGRIAKADNPIWMRPRYQNWKLVSAFQIKGTPSAAFDPSNESLYIITADSLLTLSVTRSQLTGERLTGKEGALPAGNQSIYSVTAGRLYNFYIDQQKLRTFDPATRRWDANFVSGPLTEFWQANKFLSYGDSALYIIGGYGQLRYKNRVQRYRFRDKKWDTVAAKGDYLTPRYLAALGTNTAGDTAYILGGYGSNTGDQMVNPKYNYDLLQFNVKDGSFKTINHLQEPAVPFCLANSLIIDPGSRAFYALTYPNDKFNSALQLIRGSLDSSAYQLLGDTIPYSFLDVRSFADLYYCPASKKLIAVTFYTSKDTITDVKIYSIAFPPNHVLTSAPVAKSSIPWQVFLLIIPVLGLGIWLLFRGKRKPTKLTVQKTTGILQHSAEAKGEVVSLSSQGNADTYNEKQLLNERQVPVEKRDERAVVYLFGQFELCDKDGNDLTRLFTPLLKELFSLIAIYTLRSGKGISSEKLYATLWRDKSSKDAQNNRSVNMVKLKAILDKLGTCSMVKEADKWSFQYHPEEIRIDLAECLPLLPPVRPMSKEDIHNLLIIIRRGPFMADTDYPWLEDIQSEISGKVLDVLSEATVQFSSDAEFLLEIAGGIFLFDSINEEALRIKCKSLSVLGRHSMAKAVFEKFAKEYHQMYGEEFQQTFQEVIS
jgi:two-component SAPR family response regulator